METQTWYNYNWHDHDNGSSDVCPNCGKEESETVARIATNSPDWVTLQKCACGKRFVHWG